MKKWRTLFHVLAMIVIPAVFILFIWANANAPTLSERYNTQPAEMNVYKADSLPEPAACALLENKIKSMKGVTAVTINTSSGMIAILYNKGELSSDEINKAFASERLQLTARTFETYRGPQCPVPHQYISYLQKTKSLFRFR